MKEPDAGKNLTCHEFSSVQSLSCVRLSVTPWTTARHASLSITNSWSLLKLMSIESVMPSNYLIFIPFSRLQSFPASGSFQMSQLFASGGQSIGISASTSVLPMNIQDWFPLGWTGWISLQSKGLSRVFSSTTVQNQFFCAQLSLWSNSHVHTRPLEKPGMLRFILFSQPFRVLLRCFKCSIQNLSQDWNFDSYFLSLLSSQTRYWISKDEPYIVWSFI